jgi:gas vesicle protein
MRFRKREPLLSVLLNTGIQLLESVRERLPDNIDDIKERVRDGYDTASERISRASNAIRGEEESHILGTVGALLVGVGIGVGIGILIAPASGDVTRSDLTDKFSEFGDKVREALGKTPESAGTET